MSSFVYNGIDSFSEKISLTNQRVIKFNLNIFSPEDIYVSIDVSPSFITRRLVLNTDYSVNVPEKAITLFDTLTDTEIFGARLNIIISRPFNQEINIDYQFSNIESEINKLPLEPSIFSQVNVPELQSLRSEFDSFANQIKTFKLNTVQLGNQLRPYVGDFRFILVNDNISNYTYISSYPPYLDGAISPLTNLDDYLTDGSKRAILITNKNFSKVIPSIKFYDYQNYLIACHTLLVNKPTGQQAFIQYGLYNLVDDGLNSDIYLTARPAGVSNQFTILLRFFSDFSPINTINNRIKNYLDKFKILYDQYGDGEIFDVDQITLRLQTEDDTLEFDIDRLITQMVTNTANPGNVVNFVRNGRALPILKNNDLTYFDWYLMINNPDKYLYGSDSSITYSNAISINPEYNVFRTFLNSMKTEYDQINFLLDNVLHSLEDLFSIYDIDLNKNTLKQKIFERTLTTEELEEIKSKELYFMRNLKYSSKFKQQLRDLLKTRSIHDVSVLTSIKRNLKFKGVFNQLQVDTVIPVFSFDKTGDQAKLVLKYNPLIRKWQFSFLNI